jgi:acetolactate synthase-1/2/3 large subunit
LRLRNKQGDLPPDELDFDPIIESEFSAVPPFRPEPEMERVRRAAALLAKAQRPMIVAGGGVAASGAHAELVQLAEKLQIPVATSLNGKGTILDDHPLAVGVSGTYSRTCANRALSEADLVFFVGSPAGGHVTHDWRVPPRGTKVIQIDIDAAELGRNYPNAVSILGDARVTLQRLIDVTERKSPESAKAWTGRVTQLVDEWRKETDRMRNSDAVPIRPERICGVLSEVLPTNGVLVSDTGHAGMWTGGMVDLKHRGQRYIRCAGSLGWGLPGAIGVKCALPDRPVVCFTGDGGAYYHLAELETAARYGINVVFIVNNNVGLNQEIPIVEGIFGAGSTEGDDIWRFEKSVNFAKAAESLGCAGIRVEKPGELKDVVQRALGMNRPVLVEVISDEQALAPTAWYPRT